MPICASDDLRICCHDLSFLFFPLNLNPLGICFNVLFPCIEFSKGSFVQWGVQPVSLLRFAVRDEAVRLVDGKLQFGDMQFIGKPNRARAFADSYSKVSKKIPGCFFRISSYTLQIG